jgi:hypothetical protein
MINSWLLSGCQGNEANNLGTTDKGGRITMQTYYIGRFALDVPSEMKQPVHATRLRYSTIEDFVWPAGFDNEQAKQALWEKRLAEIKHLTPPRKKKDVMIRSQELTGLGEWSRGVYYFGNYMDADVANFDMLVDYGRVGLWIKCDSAIWNDANQLKIFSNARNIAISFKPDEGKKFSRSTGDSFHLRNGTLYLPYLRQEQTYSRFEGHPFDLKLEVEMNETHEVEELSVAERLAASIATRFAPGVDVDTIRSRKRLAAGLKGEELVMRMSASGEDTLIQFGWEYRGKIDSGEHPEIQITMETPDGNLDQKLKIWDAIIDSFKPMYR